MLRLDSPDPDQNHPLIFLGWRWGAWNGANLRMFSLGTIFTDIAAMEVTEAATGPHPVWAVLGDDVLHHSVLLLVNIMSLQPIRGQDHLWNSVAHWHYLRSFDRDEIHAHAPTDISGIQPANLKIILLNIFKRIRGPHLQCSMVGFPWVEVIMPSPLVHVVLGSVLASLQGGRGHQATRGP